MAFRVLMHVEGGAYASDDLRRESHSLDSRDAALAEAIVFGCLRHRAMLDHVIGPKKLDLEVRIALRMGAFQLLLLDRVPPHAAVSESVELVKLAKKRSAAGLVNALLRKVQPVAWTAEQSLPGWMFDRWVAQFGRDIAVGLAQASLEIGRAHV